MPPFFIDDLPTRIISESVLTSLIKSCQSLVNIFSQAKRVVVDKAVYVRCRYERVVITFDDDIKSQVFVGIDKGNETI